MTWTWTGCGVEMEHESHTLNSCFHYLIMSIHHPPANNNIIIIIIIPQPSGQLSASHFKIKSTIRLRMLLFTSVLDLLNGSKYVHCIPTRFLCASKASVDYSQVFADLCTQLTRDVRWKVRLFLACTPFTHPSQVERNLKYLP